MEQWQDQGIVLRARAHGETGAVVTLLTERHGRHAGYVHGGQSSRRQGMLQPGNVVSARWSGRGDDHLGGWQMEPERNLAVLLMDDPLKLSALLSACALCEAALPEREGHPGLFHGLLALLDVMSADESSPSCAAGGGVRWGGLSSSNAQDALPPGPPPAGRRGENSIWGAAYVMWEIALLRELGFSLDLSRCVAGGDSSCLEWVSPKSGGAVSKEKGSPYAEKLLPLPEFLKPVRGGGDAEDVIKGLRLTRHFLEHWVFVHHKGMPEERVAFEARIQSSPSGILMSA